MNKVQIIQRDNSLNVIPYINQHTKRDWVRWDTDNLYPQRALELAVSSPLQHSILENEIAYILGAGFSKTVENIFSPNLTEGWDELFAKCVRDYVYLGCFAVQVIMNESGDKFSFYYQDASQVRLGQYNDDNVITTAYLNSDWTTNNRRNIVEIPMWGSETPKKGQPYLMYFRTPQTGQYYYSTPSWMSAANYVAADAELSRFFINYITNNFSANLAIKFPDEPTEEKKKELYESLQASFGGTRNAGSILLLFGENGTLPEISPIESVNADMYNSVVDTIKMAIVSANRLTSPVLAGIGTSTGFSSKSDELISAAVQYRLTVIAPERSFVLRGFNDMLQMNGLPRVLAVEDYNLAQEFEGTSTGNKAKEAEGNEVDTSEEQVTKDESAENNVEKAEE